MSDPVNQDIFFKVIADIRDEMRGYHERIRVTIEHGFEGMGQDIKTHIAEDLLVERRLARIETERELEHASIIRRSTAIAILVPSALMIGWTIIQRLLGWH